MTGGTRKLNFSGRKKLLQKDIEVAIEWNEPPQITQLSIANEEVHDDNLVAMVVKQGKYVQVVDCGTAGAISISEGTLGQRFTSALPLSIEVKIKDSDNYWTYWSARLKFSQSIDEGGQGSVNPLQFQVNPDTSIYQIHHLEPGEELNEHSRFLVYLSSDAMDARKDNEHYNSLLHRSVLESLLVQAKINIKAGEAESERSWERVLLKSIYDSSNLEDIDDSNEQQRLDEFTMKVLRGA